MKKHLVHYYENKLPALELDPDAGPSGPLEYPQGPGAVDGKVAVAIESIEDIATAREKGQALAKRLGLNLTQRTMVATAISELASNILLYAGRGEIFIAAAAAGERTGVTVTARDEGPGISDLGHALAGGYSSSGGLGLGLPGIKHFMDEFEIDSSPRGTTVTTTLWR